MFLFHPFRSVKRLLLIGFMLSIGAVGYFTSGGRTPLHPPTFLPLVAPSTTSTAAAEHRGVLLTPSRAAVHPGVSEPNPASVPGAVDPAVTEANLTSTICHRGYTTTVRPPLAYTGKVKRQLMASEHAAGGLGSWAADHLAPLELGGDPGYTLTAAGTPANLWLQARTPAGGSDAKDAVENALNAAVCSHRVPLAAAQRAIAADWFTAEHVLGLS